MKVTISPVSGEAGAMSNDATGGWLGTVIVFVAVFEPPSWSMILSRTVWGP